MSKKSALALEDAAKTRMARHRAVLRWLIHFWLANFLPSSTISAIQRGRTVYTLKSDLSISALCRSWNHETA